MRCLAVALATESAYPVVGKGPGILPHRRGQDVGPCGGFQRHMSLYRIDSDEGDKNLII